MKSVVLILPYFLSGVAAPFLFRHYPDPYRAGQIAGALFILTAWWALFVSVKKSFPLLARLVIALSLVCNGVFWFWRLKSFKSLADSQLLGVSGPLWHSFLTGLYLVVAVILLWGVLRKPSSDSHA